VEGVERDGGFFHGVGAVRDDDPHDGGGGQGVEVRVVRVSDSNPDILRFLTDRGVAIGTRLKVLSGLSGMGLMTVERMETEIELSVPIAEAVHVAPAT